MLRSHRRSTTLARAFATRSALYSQVATKHGEDKALMESRVGISKCLLHGLIISAACTATPSRGAITSTGDVEPGSPATWTSATTGYIARTANGTLTVNGGSALLARTGYLGFNPGVIGEVDVSGSGSKWTATNIYDGLAGVGIVSISSGAAVSSGTVYLGANSGSTGTLLVDGAGSTWAVSGGITYIGNSGTGVMNITNGAKATSGSSFLGYNSNSSATVTIDGANSSLTTSTLAIGYSGAGTLNITNQANVTVSGVTTVATNAGSSGNINFGSTGGGTLSTQQLYAAPSQLTGTGAISTQGLVTDGNILFDSTHGANQTMVWSSAGENVSVKLNFTGGNGTLGAGYEGVGNVTIGSGVTIKSATGYLGYNTGSTGTGNVTGPGSTWTTTGGLYAGYSGAGALNVSNGGSVASNTGYVGFDEGSNGTATVGGTGSSWKLSGNLYVGSSGSGSLNVTTGGAITDGAGYLGYNTGSTATATVSGAGSSWTNSSDLHIGDSGSATLTIASGGKVVNNNGQIGDVSGSTGTVTVDGAGSLWTNNAGLTIGGAGAGTLKITNGGSVTAAGVTTVGSSGTINFGANGGSLSTASLMAARNQIEGTGTINTRGLYDDGNLVFNAASGPAATELWSTPQQNVTIKLDLSGSNGTASDVGVGYQGNGTLTVQDGVTIHSASGHLGYFAGSNGAATVSGAGSAWADNGALYVGQSGTGQLNILSGGTSQAALPVILVLTPAQTELSTSKAAPRTGRTATIFTSDTVAMVRSAFPTAPTSRA